MLSRRWKIVLTIVIAIAMVAAAYVGWQRLQREQAHKNVEIAMTWTDFARQGYQEEMDIETALARGKEAVTSLIFGEMTLEDLVKNNIVVEMPALELKSGIESRQYVITDQDGKVLPATDFLLEQKYLWVLKNHYSNDLTRAIQVKLDSEAKQYQIETLGETYGLIAYEDKVSNDVNSDKSKVGLIFDTAAMDTANAAGYLVIPRFSLWSNYTLGDMEKLVEPLKGFSCGGIMFNNNAVIRYGSDDNVETVYKDMAQGLSVLDAPLVMVEFFKQKGLSNLVEAYDYNMVWLHSITDAEMETVQPSVATDRYLLAVNERNIRIVFLKSFGDNDFTATMAYAANLRDSLVDDGFQMGKAAPLEDIPESRVILVLIAFGIAAGAIFLGQRLHLLKLSAILSVLMILCVTGLMMLDNSLMAAGYIALLAAIIFPALAITTWVAESRSLGQTLLTVLKITGVTLIGALYVVGLLSHGVYMNHLEIFSGVKVAMITPLIFVFCYCLFLREKIGFLAKGKSLLKAQVRYGELVILAVLGAAFIVILLRSGNNNVEVSSLELAFRSKLGDLLLIRPRTKEFLVCTPCLVVALYFGYRDYLLPLWLLGTIGQVSILNTFCHLHTPLWVSLLRTFNGLWLGIVLGVLAVILIKWLKKKYDKKTEGNVL